MPGGAILSDASFSCYVVLLLLCVVVVVMLCYLLGAGRVYAQTLHQPQDLLVDVTRLGSGLGTRLGNRERNLQREEIRHGHQSENRERHVTNRQCTLLISIALFVTLHFTV